VNRVEAEQAEAGSPVSSAGAEYPLHCRDRFSLFPGYVGIQTQAESWGAGHHSVAGRAATFAYRPEWRDSRHVEIKTQSGGGELLGCVVYAVRGGGSHFITLQEKYENDGLQIIGISIDDSDKELRDFYDRYLMNYPVVAGDQKLAEAYGDILGLPTTLLINRDGFIEKKFTGATDFATLEREIIAQVQRPSTTGPR